MQILFLCLVILAASPSVLWAQSAYGGCMESAQIYQTRYEKLGRVQDLVCMQKALEREMMTGQGFGSCPHSAQHYQNAYETRGRVNDLTCMQKALQRELR